MCVVISIYNFSNSMKEMIRLFLRKWSKTNSSALDTTDFLRFPPALVRTPQKQMGSGKKKNHKHSSPHRPIQLKDIHASRGRDNPGFTDQDHEYDGNALYRKQLALFLNQAPSLSQHGVSIGISQQKSPSPKNKRRSVISALNKFEKSNNKHSKPPEIELLKPSSSKWGVVKEKLAEKKLSFTPAMKKKQEIEDKLVDCGTSKHSLVMI